MPLAPPTFDAVSAYQRTLGDVAYWGPYITAVLGRHGFGAGTTVHMGSRGTYPTAVVDRRVVVKLYPPFFDGAGAFDHEADTYLSLAGHPDVPAPELVGMGELYAGDRDWPWPYLVTTAVSGVSLSSCRDRLSRRAMASMAAWLGDVVRALHSVPVEPGRVMAPDWAPFCAFLERQRDTCAANHGRWRTLPARLVRALDVWLPEVGTLVDQSCPPSLLHTDIHHDHVLGQVSGRDFEPAGIIDFSDAMVGDRLYELPALHLSVFGADVDLLAVFMEQAGMGELVRPDFVRRAMAYTLLHEFDVLGAVADEVGRFRDAGTLDDLGAALWGEVRPT